MERKYDLLKKDYVDVVHPLNERKKLRLYRIIALRDIYIQARDGVTIHVKPNQVGGFIENENCLDQLDESWIDHNAKVFDNSNVSGDSYVRLNAHIYNNSLIYARSCISHYAHISNSTISQSLVEDAATVINSKVVDSKVKQNALIKDSSLIESIVKGGSLVEADSALKKTKVSDVCTIISSNLTNCKYSGRAIIKDQQKENETLEEPYNLNIEVPSVDLGKHGII